MESLKKVLILIPIDEQQKEIYESDNVGNKTLYDYIEKVTTNRRDFFHVGKIENDLKNSLFMSSSSNLNLAYIDVTKRIVVKVKEIKEILNFDKTF